MSITFTFIIQVIVFLILAWFTMKFVWPPITVALDERAKKIREGLSAADTAKAELATAHKRVGARRRKLLLDALVRGRELGLRGVGGRQAFADLLRALV